VVRFWPSPVTDLCNNRHFPISQGLFLVNKQLAVLGNLSMAGNVLDAPVYCKLASTVMVGLGLGLG
jgi:hypothetical protein